MSWWGEKGSFESRAKQMAKQQIGESRLFKAAGEQDSSAERAPFQSRVEKLFAAISTPSSTNSTVVAALPEFCKVGNLVPETQSLPWVVSAFPTNKPSESPEDSAEETMLGAAPSDEDSADELPLNATVEDDDDGPVSSRNGISQDTEVLDDNPYELCCNSKGKNSKKRVRIANEPEVIYISSDVHDDDSTVAPKTPPIAKASQDGDAPVLAPNAKRSKAGAAIKHSEKARVCFAFSQSGKCKFGDTCSFRHVVSDFVVNPEKYTKYEINWDEDDCDAGANKAAALSALALARAAKAPAVDLDAEREAFKRDQEEREARLQAKRAKLAAAAGSAGTAQPSTEGAAEGGGAAAKKVKPVRRPALSFEDDADG